MGESSNSWFNIQKLSLIFQSIFSIQQQIYRLLRYILLKGTLM